MCKDEMLAAYWPLHEETSMYLARPVFVIVFAILPVVACRPRQPPTPAGTTAADSDAAAATACANERTTQEHDLLQLLGALVIRKIVNIRV